MTISATIRFWLTAAILAAGLLVAAQAEARGQDAIRDGGDIAAAIGSGDGTVAFEFRARPEVWGDGRTWNFSSVEDRRPARHCPACTNGPVIVEVTMEDGRVRAVESQVGGRARDADRTLGDVPVEAAIVYLLDQVEDAAIDAESREEALQAAVAADGAEIWPRLLRIAQDRDQDSDVRKAALFWTAHEAGDRAAAEIEDVALATDEDTDVQQAAIFALTQLEAPASTDALLRVARENRNPDLVRNAYFWLGQQDDPRVLALFEEILLE